ncbi:MAG: hypothetical protein EU541_03780 [Promethearchaeota archaeon]|nr:MAG: hypothetical protein EU541_03780 [Candidatus Lokiarchaeota archaeon]
MENGEKNRKQSVELPIIEFFLINFICFLLPLYACFGIFFIIELILIQLLSTELIIQIIILPFLLFLLYYLYILLLIEIAAFWVKYWNKKSPPIQGVFKRKFDDIESEEGKMLKYYHRRGFIIKFPVWLASKSPFPWLLNRALRKIGHNEIKNNVIYCDSFPALEFTKIKENTFLYPGSVLSSHAVNSIFGKISILEIDLGRNTVFFPGTVAGPGVTTFDDFVIFPNSSLVKNWRGLSEKKKYSGSPAKPIDENSN